MKRLIFSLTAILILSSCAHHRDVRPGASGTHRVVVRSDGGEEGSRDAIDQAQHFCEKRGLSAAFLNEDQKYTGDLDEKTYKNAKRASKAAQAVGGAAWVFGGKKESNIGGIVGLGGKVADQTLGDGYTVEMKFRCQ